MTLDYLVTVMTEQFKLTQERIEAVPRSPRKSSQSSVEQFLANAGALNALDERVNGIMLEIGGLEKSNELVIPYLPDSVERQDGLILVKFVLRNQRGDFYSSYLRKCNLQLSHLGINSTRRFYVNESLVAARKIKAAALRLKKTGNVHSVHEAGKRFSKSVTISTAATYMRKCNLQLSHLGINSTRRFYVNESLTVAARKIRLH
ncbi:cadherin [Culex quinquefasciatus]|uniref:Cadherin n=1 Tax=Culex quinquefasciatus TaxID=7176 RepID=B0X090_CULQU|nr:cadherin [Culex quinquefasciatus]|eukprot:XP_001863062.1 cadherin [Culex quinquefasciatus]